MYSDGLVYHVLQVTQVVPGGSLVTVYSTPGGGDSAMIDAFQSAYNLDEELM